MFMTLLLTAAFGLEAAGSTTGISSVGEVSVQPAPAKPATSPAPCKEMSRRDTVTLDFADTPLRDVARVVSCLRGVNLMFVPSSLGSKKVSVISSRPVKRDAVWALFLSALRHNGLRTEKRGSFHAILQQR